MKEEIMKEEVLNFDAFGLDITILQALEEANFKTPSPIQQEVIPLIMSGKDLVGQAQTGTGKTGAFGLPALHLLKQNPGSQMLVLTPTRELAKQVSDEIYRFGKFAGIKTTVVCGGKSSRSQVESLQRGAQVLVATPGRLLDLMGTNQLSSFQPSIVVLDEADEMLDMGFLEDINHIFTYLPKKRQTLLFSATMPVPIQKLAEKILKDPLFISTKQKEKVNQDIEQFYYMIREDERDHAVIRLIDFENPEKAIIFCRTKKDVDRLTQTLLDSGYTARGLHGDMEMPQREEVIRSFRSDHLRILVATDVAARGLSVSNVSHVFNYHLPFDPNCYVHRIGRTGRAGNKGTASTLLTSREWRDFQRFEKVLGTRILQRDIPNLQQVKISKRKHLTDKILSQGVHEETEHLLQLMHEIDPKTIASKLLSMLIGQQFTIGPDRIGLERRQPGSPRPGSVPDRDYSERGHSERRHSSERGRGSERRYGSERGPKRSSPKPFTNFKSSKPFPRPKREGQAVKN